MEKLGWMSRDRWNQSINYLKTYTILDRSIDAEDVMTNQLIEQAVPI